MNWEEKLKSQFAIPVLRNTNGEELYQSAMALAGGGLKVLEITIMSDEAYSIIKKLSAHTDLVIGAGTILNSQQAKKAIDAGATFLVSPGLNKESIEYAQKASIPVIPGVLTPSEVMKAQELGCPIVKVFPIASVGGASYLKNLQGPFPQMQWMATGGIAPADIPAYIKAGAMCVGLGGNLTPAELMQAKDWTALSKLAAQVVASVKESRAALNK